MCAHCSRNSVPITCTFAYVVLAFIALLFSVIPLIEASVIGGQVTPYTGSVCQGFIDYDVWVPEGSNVSTVEATAGFKAIMTLVDPCQSVLLSYTCSIAFPRPVAVPGQNASYNLLFACESTCLAAVDTCKTDVLYLQSRGILPFTQMLLPDCSATIPGTEQYPDGAVAYQPDTSCNILPLQSRNTTCPQPMSSCPLPFVVDSVFQSSKGLKNSDDANCQCGCCLPCPQTDSFYKPGILDRGFFIMDILKSLSAFLALVVAVSYMVLPEKLQHPSNLILFAAISSSLFSAAVIPSYGDPRRIQCATHQANPLLPIVTATSYNNALCTFQGAWVIFGSMATTAWLSLVIMNLHLHTVWNAPWFLTRQWVFHAIGWGLPATLTVIAVTTKSIGWNNSNMCMATQDTAEWLLFIPMGAVMLPSVTLHVATFVYIIRVTLQSEKTEIASSSTLSSYSSNQAVKGVNERGHSSNSRSSHRRHVLNSIRIQWRAAALAVIFSVSVLVYWAFYIVEGLKTDMSWMSTWKLCIITGGGDQEQCGNKFAKGNVPDFPLMMMAEFLVSTTGVWIFALFFRQSLVKEWKKVMSGWACFRGRGREKESGQFYEC
ncbi:hypothetical protein EMPS_01941 [Entomortierella parvispora]|uniref:G-protein coupled receptors family 2 profile 2 domain-containing protein n=1 Tax=Entomortierella parvispora TaxID=205924 RepID=A0A9P3LT53_9FUNG|nr:hypothetical protein EMPS_01941 [Entomortierella parvispora]